MSYETITLHKELNIDRIGFIRFFQFMNDFTLNEKDEECLTFLFVEKGCITVTCGSSVYELHKDDALLLEAGEVHCISGQELTFSDFTIIRFVCTSSALSALTHKIIALSAPERSLIHAILEESESIFSEPPEDYSCRLLSKKNAEQIPFGAEELLQSCLQQLFIRLYRKNSSMPSDTVISGVKHQTDTEEQLAEVMAYMEENVQGTLSLEQICRHCLIDRSALSALFQLHTGYSVMVYFSLLKINAAKQMIKNTPMTFSQIAEELGYSSIHYFSRQFKKLTGLTPTDYAATVRPQ